MTEAIEFSYRKTINLGNYESEAIELRVRLDDLEVENDAQLSQAVDDLAEWVKMKVFQQIGQKRAEKTKAE